MNTVAANFYTGELDMKKILLALTVAAAFTGSAMAADLPARMPVKAPPPPVPVWSWTGCYIDGGVGYGVYNKDQFTETYPGLAQVGATTTVDGGRGYLGRFGGGCDYQLTGGGFWSNLTIGAFGDYDWMNLKGTDNFQNVGLAGVFGAPAWSYEKADSAWYVGARVGWTPLPGLLTFVSAGYTETHFRGQTFFGLNNNLPANAFLPGATYHGWFVGGGDEYKLSIFNFEGLFWKTEYRYASYDGKDLVPFGTGTNPGFAQHSTPYVQTITSSLVWRFNWTGSPVVAKY
jgi:outer membrane immunogenic protein